MRCPACTSELSPSRCDMTGLEIDSCFYCRGLWFDYNELRRFFTAPKLYNNFRLPHDSFRVKIKNPPPTRVCARCPAQALREVQIDRVEVDECPTCRGIWLDSGEISKLIDLHQQGLLKGKAETVKQIKWGKYDQSALGQVSRVLTLSLRTFLQKKEAKPLPEAAH